MQPQEGGFDWLHAISGLGGAIIGSLGTIAAWIFKAGAKEPELRADFQKTISDAEKRIEDRIDQAEKQAEVKLSSAAREFDETLRALRQKINDVELNSERTFLPKEEFKEFREEYREDMQELKALIAEARKQ